jgi:uncharacterized SAM-binding protein YcdF (DUF218 family)
MPTCRRPAKGLRKPEQAALSLSGGYGKLEIFAGYIIKTLVLPPGVNLFGMLLGFLCLRRRPRLQRVVVGSAFATLWLCCTPFVAAWLLRPLESFAALDVASLGDAQTIVVLGGGRYTDAPEFGGADTVAYDSLERIRYGAKLARELHLPVAVSGGAVFDDGNDPIGVLMARALEQEFLTPVRWVEDRSSNTAQNARNLRSMLPDQRIILVTHASHMRRSIDAFENVGFTVIPAPMGFRVGKEISFGIFDWLPSAGALIRCRAVLHERLGMAYYRLRY